MPLVWTILGFGRGASYGCPLKYLAKYRMICYNGSERG